VYRSVASMKQGMATLGVVGALALSLAFPLAGASAQEETGGADSPATAQAVAEFPIVVEMPAVLGVQVAPAPAPAAAATRVAMVDNRYTPTRLTVAAGTTVTWTNDGAFPHTVSAAGGTFESGTIDPGGSFSHTFDTPGEYAYFCRPHVFIGMAATVVVQ
jgi:plastocyanin